MQEDGTIKGPRVMTPEGVRSLAPGAERKDPIPSAVLLNEHFQFVLTTMTDCDRSIVQALLNVIRNKQYLVMAWEANGNTSRIHAASQEFPPVLFPVVYKQCGEKISALRTETDAADLKAKIERQNNGLPDVAE